MARVMLPVPGLTVLYIRDIPTFCNMTSEDMTWIKWTEKLINTHWEVYKYKPNVLLTELSLNLAGQLQKFYRKG